MKAGERAAMVLARRITAAGSDVWYSRRGIQLVAVLLLGPFLAIATERAPAASPDCPNTSWDVAHEVSVFKEAATHISAGLAADGAPRLDLNKLYQATLAPVERVTLPATTKPSQRHDSNAGMFALEVPESGSYRVSMDGPFWVEAIGAEGPITSTGFQGRQVCLMIHKIIEFPLLAGRITLQISGATSSVKLAVTRSAAAEHGPAQ